MAGARQGDGSSPSVPASWRKQLSRCDREFHKFTQWAKWNYQSHYGKDYANRARLFDEERKEIRMKMKGLKRRA